MAKYYGEIGYEMETVETSPGIWEEQRVVHTYCIDVTRNIKRTQTSESVNDNLVINNEFSILADPFAKENFHAMRYIEYMGTKWKITSVEVRYPRLILYAGGVYNGE